MTKPQEPCVLRTPEAANYLRLSSSTLKNWRTDGFGPKFIQLGPNSIRYRLDDLNSWLEENLRRSTSEAAALNSKS